MADTASISINMHKGYGLPWRVGDIVQGEMRVTDKDQNLIDVSQNHTLSAEVYEIKNGEWNSASFSATVSSTNTAGVHDLKVEPDDDGTYLIEVTLTGDHKARDSIMVTVYDVRDNDPDPRGALSGF